MGEIVDFRLFHDVAVVPVKIGGLCLTGVLW